MKDAMLKSALFYHNEGLCVIPVKPRDKAPALESWEEYQRRPSTEDEIRTWFGNGTGYNIGIVHGEVSNGYVTLDFDHDTGLFAEMRKRFPPFFTGRLEQSGSHEGYHIPMMLSELPDFGYNKRQERPRGNKTWKTKQGHCNLRCRFCQTVAPPSIHPTGNRYRFIQKGSIVTIDNLSDLLTWLDKVAPPPLPRIVNAQRHTPGERLCGGKTLLEAVKSAWPDALSVFRFFNLVDRVQEEPDGELRVLGNGGLLINSDDKTLWYNFSDEMGGGLFEAWGWCRFGSSYNNQTQFRNVLVEMAQAAGIDVTQFYKRGDESITKETRPDGDRSYWHKQYPGRWNQMRV